MTDYAEIQGSYEKATTNILGNYFEGLGRLKNDARMEDGERSRSAWAFHETAKQMLAEATRQRNEKIAEREGDLRRKLFGGPRGFGPEAQAAARGYQEAVRKAFEQQYMLDELLSVAIKSGDEDLARAAFTVADETGAGEVVQRYLEHDEGARQTYRELVSIPDAETRERAVQRAPEAIVRPTEDMVRPTPEAFERMRRERQAPPLAAG